MQAVIYDGALRVADDVPKPQATDDIALVRVRRAGICNTDLELIQGYYQFSGILGHEFVGEVVEGPAEWLGRRVVAEINIADGICDMCRKGIFSQCRQRKVIGIHDWQGAFAEYLPVPISNLHHVPDAIDDDQAVFVEPLASALQMSQISPLRPTESVIVLGAGKLGLLCAQVLRLTGATVRVIARHERQLQLARQWGLTPCFRSDVPDNSADVVVDCTGRPEGFADALALVAPRGKLFLKSTYAEKAPLNLSQIAVKEIQVIGSRCGPFSAALQLLAMGLVDVTSLIEARYPLSEATKAIEHAARRGALKVLLDYSAT